MTLASPISFFLGNYVELQNWQFRSSFVKHGYAWVDVDVRGALTKFDCLGSPTFLFLRLIFNFAFYYNHYLPLLVLFVDVVFSSYPLSRSISLPVSLVHVINTQAALLLGNTYLPSFPSSNSNDNFELSTLQLIVIRLISFSCFGC